MPRSTASYKSFIISVGFILGAWRLFDVPNVPATFLGWVVKFIIGMASLLLLEWCMEEKKNETNRP